jgi:peptidoglycan hydrolase CwlO-like protein
MEHNYSGFIGVIATISALIGAASPIMAKFVIEFFSAKRKTDLEELQKQFEENRKERANLINDLQKQIFTLREQQLEQQKYHFACMQENAELNARVKVLTELNEELHKRVDELEIEIKQYLLPKVIELPKVESVPV